MRTLHFSRTLNAPRTAIWEVLADFANIHLWNRGVTSSQVFNDVAQGIGAQRHCQMAPMGSLTESATAWDHETLLRVRIDASRLIPIKTATVDYKLEPSEIVGNTNVSKTYQFTPKWSFIAGFIGSVIEKSLNSAFEDVLTDLETAANSGKFSGSTVSAISDQKSKSIRG